MDLDHAEVVIIGAGINGLSSGFWLAKAGVDVVVVEKGIVGWEASGRNGGGCGHRSAGSPVDALAVVEEELWPQLDELLGYPCEFVPGNMSVALDEATLEDMRRGYERNRQAGIHVEFIDPPTIKEWAPLVTDDVLGGTYMVRGGHANPQRSVQAFAWAFQDLGGRIYQHATVTGITVKGDKAVSVETTRGSIGAEFVVSAAGPQTGIICDMVGAFVPVAPGRVEVIVTEPLPIMPMGKLSTKPIYGRQSLRGNLIYGGGSNEWVEVDLSTPEKPNTALIRNIGRRLVELYPSAADVRIIRSWGGITEETPDFFPIIDTLDQPNNFVVLTMSGNGFGLGPATGKAVSELVMHGESSVSLDQLRLSRFKDVPRNWREVRGWVPAPERE